MLMIILKFRVIFKDKTHLLKANKQRIAFKKKQNKMKMRKKQKSI